MAELKTKMTSASAAKFIAGIEDEQMRRECQTLNKLLRRITEKPPKMWGESIVGYGSYHYKYASGREGDWFIAGFSPRKQNLTIYVMAGFSQHKKLLDKLGKHKLGKCCLYLKRLDDLDPEVLEELLTCSVEFMQKNYSCK